MDSSTDLDEHQENNIQAIRKLIAKIKEITEKGLNEKTDDEQTLLAAHSAMFKIQVHHAVSREYVYTERRKHPQSYRFSLGGTRRNSHVLDNLTPLALLKYLLRHPELCRHIYGIQQHICCDKLALSLVNGYVDMDKIRWPENRLDNHLDNACASVYAYLESRSFHVWNAHELVDILLFCYQTQREPERFVDNNGEIVLPYHIAKILFEVIRDGTCYDYGWHIYDIYPHVAKALNIDEDDIDYECPPFEIFQVVLDMKKRFSALKTQH